MWPFKKKQPTGADPREKWGTLFRYAGEASNRINALLESLGKERDKSRQRDANYTALLASVIKAIDYCEMIEMSTPLVQSVVRSVHEKHAEGLSQQGVRPMEVKPGQKVSEFPSNFLSITPVEGNDGEILKVIEPGYETAEGQVVRPCSVFVGRKSPLPEQTNTGSESDKKSKKGE